MRKSKNMKSNNTIEHLILGGVLLWAASSSYALTLGKARGAVLLGQPLSLTIVLQYEADEAFSDWCFDADVYYGDIRQEGSRVSATPLRADTGALTGVRVIAAAPVDEPVVTVYLRSGCGLKTSRKYVLLSDLASDLAPFVSGESALQSVAPASLQSAQPKPVLANRAGKLGEILSKPPKTAKVQKGEAQKGLPIPFAVQPAPSQRARLKVSILDLMDIKAPDLRLSGELLTIPSDDTQKRDAAKALWRSLNTSSSDVLRDEVQRKAISADLKGLKDISDKNQSDLKELSQRLTQAESERFANPLIFVLAGLLIASVFAVILLIAKLRAASGKNAPWWRGIGSNEDDEDDFNIHDSDVGIAGNAPGPIATASTSSIISPKSRASTASAAIPQSLDIDLDLSSPMFQDVQSSSATQRNVRSAAAAMSPTAPAPIYQRDFSHSLNATLHAINTQEMLDVRQQADFFMTLGQHEEAITLLETSIRESDASNPLVYIDLLKVLHTLSRKPAFDHYRNEFNAIFTGWAPQYAVFGQPGNSLDAYPQICAEISQVWGSESALEFLEQCMVRSPEDAPEHYFDLDAFRDLLLLHAIAGRIGMNSSTDSGLMPFSAMRAAASSVAVATGVEEQQTLEQAHPADVRLMVETPKHASVELSIVEADNNLIDFDASGLSESLPLREPK